MATEQRWGALRWFLIFMGLCLLAWLSSIGPDLWDALVIDMRIEWAKLTGGLWS